MSYSYDRRVARGPLLTKQLMTVLLRIDRGPYHQFPADKLPKSLLPAINALLQRDLIRLVPAGHYFPAHYVLTSGGSHAIGTFDQIKMANMPREVSFTFKTPEAVKEFASKMGHALGSKRDEDFVHKCVKAGEPVTYLDPYEVEVAMNTHAMMKHRRDALLVEHTQ